jgi:hypothetical protein
VVMIIMMALMLMMAPSLVRAPRPSQMCI